MAFDVCAVTGDWRCRKQRTFGNTEPVGERKDLLMHAPRNVFIGDDFLLDNQSARALYHDHARDLPIIDFHTHVVPAQILHDQRFSNLTQLWLDEDRGKWRLMRQHGVHEDQCSGDAPPYEKFHAWAKTLPKLIGSPIYQWSHMELTRAFGLSDTLLNQDTASDVWSHCNELLTHPEFSARALMEQARVRVLCTTDDPTDSLACHRAAAEDPTLRLQLLPTWRPDRAYTIDDVTAFNTWVDQLAAVTRHDINDLDAFLQALQTRHDYFAEHGCNLSDRGLTHLPTADFHLHDVKADFRQLRRGQALTPPAAASFQAFMLHELALFDHAKGWTQQLHIGALRDCNSRLLKRVGPDMGGDSIGDYLQASALAHFLDRLDRTNQLPRTIIYNLNPGDYDIMATMTGNFPDHEVPGKIQLGSAWWFNDHEDGITLQLRALARNGVLSRFVGMVTDSRSLLSYVRHEYFRRVLCNMLGGDVERGRLPNDMKLLSDLVTDICYRNAASFLGYQLEQATRPRSIDETEIKPAAQQTTGNKYTMTRRVN